MTTDAVGGVSTDAEPPTTYREIARLAIPAMVSGLAVIAYHWVNQIWVGRIAGQGAAPTAALSVSTFGTWAFGALSALAATGIGAVVGRYVGARREPAARYVALHGIRFAALLGVVCGAAGILLAPTLVAVTRISPRAGEMGVDYLRALYTAGFALLAQGACDAVFRAHGDTRTPFLVTLGVLAMNAGLDPLLIFGGGPVPAFGVAGAGIASAISATVGAGVSFLLLRRLGHVAAGRPSDDVLRLDPTTPLERGPLAGLDLSVIRRVARIGLPPALAGLFFVAIYLVLSSIVTRVGGDAAQAGLGAGLRGEQVAYFAGLGFAVAATSLVSRRLGAGRIADAQRSAVRATIAATALCGIWGALLFVFADDLARMFIPDTASPEARAIAVDFYRIVSPCLLFQCWEHVLEGAFAGAGLTWPPMAVSVALTVIRLPLASYVAIDRGGGVQAIWVVIAITAGLRGVCIALWFARGTWKHRRV